MKMMQYFVIEQTRQLMPPEPYATLIAGPFGTYEQATDAKITEQQKWFHKQFQIVTKTIKVNQF